MFGFTLLSTIESKRISGLEGSFGGGTTMPRLPIQYCPTRTRDRYMKCGSFGKVDVSQKSLPVGYRLKERLYWRLGDDSWRIDLVEA